jgi:hypothetical protein
MKRASQWRRKQQPNAPPTYPPLPTIPEKKIRQPVAHTRTQKKKKKRNQITASTPRVFFSVSVGREDKGERGHLPHGGMQHDLSIDDMPEEIVAAVLAAARPVDRHPCRRVCWRWRALTPPVMEREYPIPYTSALAAEGDVRMLRWALEEGFLLRGEQACKAAARSGSIEMLSALSDRGLIFDRSTVRAAARCGQVDAVLWLREQGCPWDSDVPRAFAAAGSIEGMEMAMHHRCSMDVWLNVSAACRKGRLEVLEWIAARVSGHRGADGGHDVVVLRIMLQYFTGAVVKQGHLHLLRWMADMGVSMKGIGDGAVMHERWEVLEWLEARRRSTHPHERPLTCAGALMIGDVDAAERLYSPHPHIRGHDFGLHAAAARSGDVRAVEWVRSKGLPWDEEACNVAAAPLLKWLIENGCPHNSGVCVQLARAGDVEALTWAIGKGCVWTSHAYREAAKWRRLNVLRWAHDAGLRLGDRGGGEPKRKPEAVRYGVVMEAAAAGHVDVLAWASTVGLLASARSVWKMFRAASANRRHAVIRWALAEGFVPERDSYEVASRKGWVDTVRLCEMGGCGR